ncbi:hypothetical protein ACIQWZ_09575 [Streptomyces sp. NPDC098077]
MPIEADQSQVKPTQANPTGAQLTFSSPGTDPSHLSVPLREK